MHRGASALHAREEHQRQPQAPQRPLAHGPEKWIPVFRKACPRARPEGHAQTQDSSQGTLMIRLVSILVLASIPTIVFAQHEPKPEWAFPVTEKDQPPPRIPGDKVRTVGNVTVTRAKADDMYDIPAWRPDMPPKMPKIVQFGNKDTQVRACGSCHLPTGNGHDESAYTAGLTFRYLTAQ